MQVETAFGPLFCRPDTSDEKTIKEVITKNAYQKRHFKVLPGEEWLDLGANIGAFTVMASKIGAKVTSFEPDPGNFQVLKQNVEQNKLVADIKNIALWHKPNGTAEFFVNGTNHWRNSLVKHWKRGPKLEVNCEYYGNYFRDGLCVKMDIEGSEMALIEDMPETLKLKKLVLEWSFDMDNNIDRYRAAVSKLERMFKVVKASKIKEEHKVWLPSWFPPCKMIWAWNEE